MVDDAFRRCMLSDLAHLRNGKGLSPFKYSSLGKHPVWGANGKIASVLAQRELDESFW